MNAVVGFAKFDLGLSREITASGQSESPDVCPFAPQIQTAIRAFQLFSLFSNSGKRSEYR